MNNLFKLQGKEKVCNKDRNIFVKINKKTETKFIKYKGEYIKLKTYVKNYKYHKENKNNRNKLNIINNIKDIKDKKIRDVFNRRFEKNAKIYILSKKHLKGGARVFDNDVSRNNDIIANRKIGAPIILVDNRTIIDIEYLSDFDDIFIEVEKIAKDTSVPHIFEKINNLWYTIVIIDKEIEYKCFIRPHITYTPYQKFYLYFYFTIDNESWGGSGNRRWIKLPFHISLIFNEMILNNYENKNKIECITSSHIHLTSEKLDVFNIKTRLEVKSHKTHTYLIAKSIKDFVDIMDEHGKTIFEDWSYVSNKDNEINITVWRPNIKRWEMQQDPRNSSAIIYKMEPEEKKVIFDCFKKMRFIISNVFDNLKISQFHNHTPGDNIKVKLRDTSKPENVNEYLEFKMPASAIPNVRYNDIHISHGTSKDKLKRQGIITITDVVNSKSLLKEKCPGIESNVLNTRDFRDSRDYNNGHSSNKGLSQSLQRHEQKGYNKGRSPPIRLGSPHLRFGTPPIRLRSPPLRERTPPSRLRSQYLREITPPSRLRSPPLRERTPPSRLRSRDRERYRDRDRERYRDRDRDRERDRDRDRDRERYRERYRR
jgi:hypothetical protein